ncbi:hypothetical protein D3C79_960100 [compost metagenome]
MSECLGQAADRFEAELVPQRHSYFISGYDRIELQRQKTLLTRLLLRMLTHQTCHATATCSLADHVTAVAHMGTRACSIGLEVVGTQQFTLVLQHPGVKGQL